MESTVIPDSTVSLTAASTNDGLLETIAKWFLSKFDKTGEVSAKALKRTVAIVGYVFMAVAIVLTLILIQRIYLMNVELAVVVIAIFGLIKFVAKKDKWAGNVLVIFAVVALIMCLATFLFPRSLTKWKYDGKYADNKSFQNLKQGSEIESSEVEDYEDEEADVNAKIKQLRKEGKEAEAHKLQTDYMEKGKNKKIKYDTLHKKYYGESVETKNSSSAIDPSAEVKKQSKQKRNEVIVPFDGNKKPIPTGINIQSENDDIEITLLEGSFEIAGSSGWEELTVSQTLPGGHPGVFKIRGLTKGKVKIAQYY